MSKKNWMSARTQYRRNSERRSQRSVSFTQEDYTNQSQFDSEVDNINENINYDNSVSNINRFSVEGVTMLPAQIIGEIQEAELSQRPGPQEAFMLSVVNDQNENIPAPQVLNIVWNVNRNHPVQHRRSYRQALALNNTVEIMVQQFDLGLMNVICPHCSAKFFSSELPARGSIQNITRCCKGGEFVLERFRDCPRELRDLYTGVSNNSRQFLQNIRYLNNLFAMASFKTSGPLHQNLGQGRWLFGVTGQIYHYVEPVPVNTPTDPRYNQYYFIDAEDAIMRRSALAAEHQVSQQLVELIETIMRNHNPFVRAFRTMREVINGMRLNGQNVDNFVMGFKRNMNQYLRRHDLPESRSDVAAVFTGEDPPFEVDLRIYPRNDNHNNELKNLNCLADPMVYPLLFPTGAEGYRTGIPYRTKADKTVTFRQFYRFHIQERDGFSIIHNGGKLFQQYLVDAWVKTEANYLWWLKCNAVQKRLLPADRIRDFLGERGIQRNMQIGKICILPSSFQGGPRNMNRLYLDAMAVVSRHGKPDLFVTFTCNPEWPEIKNNLSYRQTYQHRPDLVCRVFHAKFKVFLDDFVEKQLYGVILSYTYTIEIQKRGLPHAHILFTFRPEDKLETVEDVESVICAEVPDPLMEPELYNIISNCYIHRLCGDGNPIAPCMVNGKCSKGYPKAYCGETILRDVDYGRSGRVLYRRPLNGPRIITASGITYDSTRVIPYNRYAAKKYNCHINFELCGSLKTIKYLHKYITKGSDRVLIQARENENTVDWDEITAYTDCRYVSSTEAAWRISELPMHGRSHSVLVLPVHLPGQQEVIVDDLDEDVVILNAADRKSKLTAWFLLNQVEEEAHQYKYVEIPDHYRWDTSNYIWVPRRQISKQIGCLVEVSPVHVELFHLRILLATKRGATSYEDLLRLPNGNHAENFQTACQLLNLLENADEYDRCLAEAVVKGFPIRLRRLFALICLLLIDFNRPYIRTLWDKYWQYLVEDFLGAGSERNIHVAINCSLVDILDRVRLSKPYMTLEELNLPNTVNFDGADNDATPQDIDVSQLEEVVLNDQQKVVVKNVLSAIGRYHRSIQEPLVENTGSPIERRVLSIVNGETVDVFGNMFYVDGPGGSGKTFLYNYLLKLVVKVLRRPVRAVAWTGIAATLLHQGKTVHGAFRLPLDLTEETVAGPRLHTSQAEALKQVSLIVWDEASMSPKMAVHAVDRFFRELMGKPWLPFGGKVVLFGGDFRQVLPIVNGGSRMDVVRSCLRASFLWRDMRRFRLVSNMRAQIVGDLAFADFLMQLGEGRRTIQKPARVEFAPDDLVLIPEHCTVRDPNELCRFVYGDEQVDFADKCILCPTNAMVKQINENMLESIPGQMFSFFSVDSYTAPVEDGFYVTEDVLHSIEIASLPPHELRLKVGSIVVLLRNLCLEYGQSNGVRLRILSIGSHMLEVEILTGTHRGERFWLPKVKMTARSDFLPKDICRIQYPVKLAYAMTIHKAQGQTFLKVGIYLDRPCFSHGQLYVAFSRVGSFDRVRVFVQKGLKQGTFRCRNKTFTRNVVYGEILDRFEFPLVENVEPDNVVDEENQPLSRKKIRLEDAKTVEDVEYLHSNIPSIPIGQNSSVVPGGNKVMDFRVLGAWNIEDRRNRVAVGDRAGTSKLHHTPPPKPVYSDDSDDSD